MVSTWLMCLLVVVQATVVIPGEVEGRNPIRSLPQHLPLPHNTRLSHRNHPRPLHILSLLQRRHSHLPRLIPPATLQELDHLRPASLHAVPRVGDIAAGGVREDRTTTTAAVVVAPGGGGGGGDGGKVVSCGACPAAHAIAPCMCECMNSTVAELTCGSSLVSCAQLTDILTTQDFPTNYYIRLLVDGTTLGCTLEESLWGPIKFQEILLTNNHFSTLDNHAFDPFIDTLKLLNLEKNSLENVYFPTLSELSHLEVLLLAHNRISFIPSFSPICLGRLRKLTLSYNKIQFLQQRTFADLPELLFLDLSHNLISDLPSEAFTIPGHRAEVLQVDLAYNTISRLEYGVVDGPTSCILFLQYNQLETLQEEAFVSIINSCSTTARIMVTGNPLTCDERLCWLVTNETIRASFDDFHCPNLDNNPVDVILPMCQALQQHS